MSPVQSVTDVFRYTHGSLWRGGNAVRSVYCRTPVCQRCVHTVLMPVQHSHEVTNAERVRGGILMTFADGRCALFAPELLYSLLPQAQEMPDDIHDED
jgi:hypothetical protein